MSTILFINLIILNHVKIGRIVTFIKYLASVFYLIILPKTLIWIKMVILGSNILKLSELVVNKLRKNVFESIYEY